MSDVIDIGMGKLVVSDGPRLLATSGIGSCVVVCLYAKAQKIGALAHIMLPQKHTDIESFSEIDHKYADVAMAVMIQQLEAKGIYTNHLSAKIAGGANMFPNVQGRSQRVGEKNIEAVHSLLQTYNIKIAGEDTGGTTGRSLTFDLSNGIVTIKVTI